LRNNDVLAPNAVKSMEVAEGLITKVLSRVTTLSVIAALVFCGGFSLLADL
jgi:hypothetical protein